MATIALYGATGTIGSRVVDEALRRGHTVTAVLRDPAKLERTDVVKLEGDVANPDAEQLRGHDVVVSSVNGDVALAARELVGALRTLDVTPRLVVVNGAGSLETAPGVAVWDAPGLPDWLLAIMHSHGDALDYLNTVDDVPWTAFSPAGTIEPGERTGEYRLGGDQLVVDAEGKSWISAEDYAVALVDEIENPKHIGRRFTAAR
ncbi:NAD(P)H-binding protein [Actinosynnema sp. NPDC020468]|uniref:NAD(P)-dependent oxidoreductase n=1 Tax=Actinosynnema sp. NPDC020468 TaxID=3154488 RepID=UPI0033F9DB8B